MTELDAHTLYIIAVSVSSLIDYDENSLLTLWNAILRENNPSQDILDYLHASYLSLDEINEARGLFGGQGIPVEEWEKTHSIAMQQLHSLMMMASQQDVVLDDTSCFRWLRDRYRDLGQQCGYQTILIYLDIPISEIQRRMEKNERAKTSLGVRQETINEMARTFESPQADEIVIKYSPGQNLEEWIEGYLVTSIIRRGI